MAARKKVKPPVQIKLNKPSTANVDAIPISNAAKDDGKKPSKGSEAGSREDIGKDIPSSTGSKPINDDGAKTSVSAENNQGGSMPVSPAKGRRIKMAARKRVKPPVHIRLNHPSTGNVGERPIGNAVKGDGKKPSQSPEAGSREAENVKGKSKKSARKGKRKEAVHDEEEELNLSERERWHNNDYEFSDEENLWTIFTE